MGAPKSLTRLGLLPLTVAAALQLGACAAVPTDPMQRVLYDDANDPLEPMNRAFFAFNLKVDEIVLEPAARGYRDAVPRGGRDAIQRFLHNLKSPVTFANDLLQANFENAYQTLGSFLVNSTIGILGFFNPAQADLREEDFGQTLAVWGAHAGPYLVLPLFGPSNLRDATSYLVDPFFDPLQSVIDDPQRTGVALGRAATGAVDDRSRTMEAFADLKKNSFDFYTTARSLYRQSRGNDIRNGAPEPVDYPTN